MKLFSSAESSEEEMFDLLAALSMPRIFLPPKHPFEIYDDDEFQMRYRLNKNSVTMLVNLIGHNIEPRTHRNQLINSVNQILIALRFLATGSFQIVLSDNMNIHKTTVCRIVSKVIPRIAALHDAFISMPTDAVEIANVKQNFHTIAGFPSVIGCVDGTHVKIQSPGGENAERYRNRKHFFLSKIVVPSVFYPQ